MKILTLLRVKKTARRLGSLWLGALRIARYYPHKILPLGIIIFAIMVGIISHYLSHLEFKMPSPRPVTVTIPAGTLQPAKKPASAPSSAVKPAAKTPSLAGQYGFSAGDLSELSSAELEARLTDFNVLGITWVRFDMPWNDVQPNGPSHFDWSGYDRVVAAANRHKIHVLMLLDYTPGWARRKDCTDTNKCTPSDNAQFALYAAAAAGHFAPQGVKYWEIWNEPNHVGAWAPTPDPKAYTDLLIQSYAAIKKADPAAFVITGGTGVTYTEAGNIGPSDFLSSIYKYGGKNSFDGVGQHPYTYPGLAALNEAWTGWYQMLAVKSVMAANGDAGKPIWLTEYGAPTNGPGALATMQNFNFENNPDHVDEALQQQMATEAVRLYKTYTWTGPLFWYGYKDLGTDAGSNENFFGLLRADGSQKPSYATFKSLLH